MRGRKPGVATALTIAVIAAFGATTGRMRGTASPIGVDLFSFFLIKKLADKAQPDSRKWATVSDVNEAFVDIIRDTDGHKVSV
jgi:hypothetical protein